MDYVVLLSPSHVTPLASLPGHMTFPKWLPPWQSPHGRLLTLEIVSFHSGSVFLARRLYVLSLLFVMNIIKDFDPIQRLVLI